MKATVYICRSCGEAKPATAFKRWITGLEGVSNIAHCHYCLECQDKKRKNPLGKIKGGAADVAK